METKDQLSHFTEQYLEVFSKIDMEQVEDTIDVLEKAYKDQATVISIGNGGSASTAAHFAADLGKFAAFPNTGFKAIDLCSNYALSTAWTNDEGWESVYENMLMPWVEPESVVIAFSVNGGNGFSSNLVRGIEYATKIGATTIGLAGNGGGDFATKCDIFLEIPTPEDKTLITPITEAAQVGIHHLICDTLRKKLN